MVDRIRTTSVLCVGEMCWVMCTMESMATSGLAWTRLEMGRKKKGVETKENTALHVFADGGLMMGEKRRCLASSPAYLLEDVISADVLDVLVDDGPRALFFS